MLTVADRSPAASTGTSYRQRSAVLAAARDGANWHPADCRPVFRDAIRSADLPVAVRSWACWLADRFKPNGELVLRGGIAAVVEISPASERTTYRYLALLERAGLVERDGTTRRLGERRYVRFTHLRIGAAIRQPAPVLVTCETANRRQTRSPYLSVDGSVSDLTTDRKDEREIVDNDWHRLARARSDVPLLRPGYKLPDVSDMPLGVVPAPERRPIDPALAALIARDPREAIRQMSAFGMPPEERDDIPSYMRGR